MYQPFQEHVLNAPDVCNNCFRLIRVERAHTESRDPKKSTSVTKSAYTSVGVHTTSLEYAPHESPAKAWGIFCDCGTESAYDRTWADRRPDRNRFREFVQNLLRTLDRKGVTVDRERTAYHALTAFDERPRRALLGTYILRPSPTVNECLARGMQHGLQRAASAKTSKQHPLSGD
jgi:hypothetical protein